MNVGGITERRRKWPDALLEDSRVLLSQVGPEIACKLPGSNVRLVSIEDFKVRAGLRASTLAGGRHV